MKIDPPVPAGSATPPENDFLLLNGFLPSSPGMTLPPELLLQIFEHLALPDLLVCSEVCLYWHEVSQNAHLWKNLAQEGWKIWTEGSIDDIEDDGEKDWQQVYRKRYLQDRTLPKLLKEMVCDETRHQATSKITEYGLEVFEALEKLMDKLYLDQPDCVPRDPWPPYPLVRHIDVLYRAKNVHEILYTKCYVPSWQRLRENANATMEDGAILLSEWGTQQCGAQIRNHLDLLACSFARKILTSEGVNIRNACSLKDLSGAMENLLQTRSRLSVLADLLEFLASDVGLKGVRHQDYYDFSNSFLHSVLVKKCGIPISLSVIYSSVASRVGIEVQALNTPGHFLLFYDGSRYLETSKAIDPFNNRMMTLDELESFIGEQYTLSSLPRAAPWEVWYRMLANLRHIYNSSSDSRLSAVLTFMLQLQENQNDYFLSIIMYKSRGFVQEALNDLERVKALAEELDQTTVRRLEEHINEGRETKPEVRSRREKAYQCVKYPVGTVFCHSKYRYRGVIFRWDPVCTATHDWISQMGVNRLPRGTQQPFYSVRVDDRDRPSQITYVAEDNIGPISEDMIQSPDLGMYFESYDVATHTYIPNEGLKRQFPHG